MDGLVRLLRAYLNKFWTTPYPLTGLVGLAGCIFTLWQLLGGRRKQLAPRHPPAAPSAASGTSADGTAMPQPQHQPPQGKAQQQRLLTGVRQISISALGVLVVETSPSQLEESATLLPDAARLLRSMCSACTTAVLAQVESDVGEATLRGALEAADLLGTGPGQLPPHRLLFCSTVNGKASIVRQLDPQLHIDASAQTVLDLQRFVQRMVFVAPGAQERAAFSSHVELVPELASAFGR